MEVQGKIKVINETQTFGKNDFKKRECVVTTEDQYPQDILIEFVQDKTGLLNNFKIGQDVTISINLRGRGWTNPQGEVKYFNSIHGWKIATKDSATKDAPFETISKEDLNNESDDLPF